MNKFRDWPTIKRKIQKVKMIQKNDFIEIEYTGKTKDEGIIFDTTDEKLAKEQGFLQENAAYGPVIICVGQNQVISGLDNGIFMLKEL